jgi:hypothetical protein
LLILEKKSHRKSHSKNPKVLPLFV